MGTLTLAGSTVSTASAVSKVLIPAYTDSDTTDTFTIRVPLSGIATPGTFSVSSLVVNGSPTLTTTNTFNSVRKGDGLAGTGIPGGATVSQVVHVEGGSVKALTMSANATAGDGVTPVSITFTPAAPTGDVFVISGALTPQRTSSGANDAIALTVDVYVMDGKNQSPSAPSINDAVKAGTVVAEQSFVTFERNTART
jgi:hypothetical protein